MNIAEAKEEIKNTVRVYLEKTDGDYAIPVERQRPVLLIGAPGIGKTAIMSAIADELGIGYLGYTITHHTRQSAIGLPYITKKIYGGKEYSVTEYTMSEIVASVYDAIETQGKSEGILFIDEINCVSETLAPAMLELLQHKKFGPHKIPDGWILTAAGNPSVYNKSVNELDMVTLDRVKLINVEPDYDAFAAYAATRGIHPSITGFLANNKDCLFKAERTADGFEFVTPRGWEDMSAAITEYERSGIKVSRSLVGQYVQSPETAAAFFRYYDTFTRLNELYDAEKVESGESCADLSGASFEERFAVAETLKNRACHLAESAVIYGEGADAAEKSVEQFLKTGDKNALRSDALKATEIISSPYTDAHKKAVYRAVIGILNDENPVNALEKAKQAADKNAEEISRKIENILIFGERALQKRQEFTSAVTGMLASVYFVEFLTRYGCDEFYRINSELLVGGENLREKAAKALKSGE